MSQKEKSNKEKKQQQKVHSSRLSVPLKSNCLKYGYKYCKMMMRKVHANR